jgi:hypothetical protein
MKFAFAFLLFVASAMAQQRYVIYGPTTGPSSADLRGYSNIPTCDAKYEYVGVVYNENLVAENRCMPQVTLVSVQEWDELRAQVAELQQRLQDLEARTNADQPQTPSAAATPRNSNVQSRERK